MEMDDQIYEINIKRFIQSTDFQLKKLSDCINRLHEVIIASVLLNFELKLSKN